MKGNQEPEAILHTVAALRLEMERVNAQIGRTRAALVARNQQLSRQLKVIGRERGRLHERALSRERELEQLRRSLADAELSARGAEAELAASHTAVEGLKARVAKVEYELCGVQREYALLQEYSETMKDKLGLEQRSAELAAGELKRAEDRLSRLQGENDALKEQARLAQRAAAERGSELKVAASAAERLNNALESANTELGAIQEDRAEAWLRYRELEDQNRQSARDLTELASYAADLEERLGQLLSSRSWRALSIVRRLTAKLRSLLRGGTFDPEVSVPSRPGSMERGLRVVPMLDAPVGELLSATTLEERRDVVGLRAAVSTEARTKIHYPVDYHRLGSEGVILPRFQAVRLDRKLPAGFPLDLCLPKPIGNKNDFGFLTETVYQVGCVGDIPRTSIQVIAWIRSAREANAIREGILSQTLPRSNFNVTLYVDCADEIECSTWSDHVCSGKPWQGASPVREACDADELLVFLDGSILIDTQLLERVARYGSVSPRVVLGFATPASRAPQESAEAVKATTITDDWRKARFPFRNLQALNFAIPSQLFQDIGGFDARFQDYRKVAMELGYRAYNRGAYFIPIPAVAQPARQPSQETIPKDAAARDAKLFRELCPVHWYRPDDGVYEVPKVSIYIPAYNAERFICEAIDSVLDQDFRDLEVCVHVDGSPDNTLAVLEERYTGDPRVRWSVADNAGIGHASNQAIALTRGLYIGQLDSDDRLKPGAIRKLVEVLDSDGDVGCAYSSCERVDANGQYVQDEYSWPVFTREKMMLTSIVHHFRMFRRQVWERTEKFRTDIANAVDYDMFLKISDVAEMHHVDEKLYQRRWHGGNTSNVNEGHQTTNTHVVQTDALERNGLVDSWQVTIPDPSQPRRVTYSRRTDRKRIVYWPDYTRSNPYQRLLYRESVHKSDILAGDIDVAIKLTRSARDPGNVLFHLHWLNPLVEGASSAAELKGRFEAFLGKIKKLRWLGGKVVWTIHNCVSHDARHPEVEKHFSASLAAAVDWVHVHSESSIREIEAFFPLPLEKVIVSRHGSYDGIYPNYIPRTLARRQLKMEDGDRVVLFLGQIRPYKGLDALLLACQRMLDRGEEIKLILAGKANYDVRAHLASAGALANRVTLIDRYIEDAELQVLFNAADVGVFPYKRILTSGSLMLSLSYGLPAIVPAVGMTKEVLGGRDAGIVYGPNAECKDLEEALMRALAVMSTNEWELWRRNAMQVARDSTWPEFLSGLEARTPAD